MFLTRVILVVTSSNGLRTMSNGSSCVALGIFTGPSVVSELCLFVMQSCDHHILCYLSLWLQHLSPDCLEQFDQLTGCPGNILKGPP